MKANLKPVPKPCAKKIYEHMENYLYKINEKEGNYEIGFFIRLKDEKDKSHLALVTSPNVLKDLDSNSLKITLDHEPKLIELGNIRYEDKKYFYCCWLNVLFLYHIYHLLSHMIQKYYLYYHIG